MSLSAGERRAPLSRETGCRDLRGICLRPSRNCVAGVDRVGEIPMELDITLRRRHASPNISPVVDLDPRLTELLTRIQGGASIARPVVVGIEECDGVAGQ